MTSMIGVLRLASANGIHDRSARRLITRLTSANGIRDKIVEKWITRLASANGIRDRIAGKWITRLASANGIREMNHKNRLCKVTRFMQVNKSIQIKNMQMSVNWV